MKKRLRVMFVVNSLSVGGAERQVIELATNLDRGYFEPLVCSIGDEEPWDKELASRGVHCISLPRRPQHDFSTLFKLRTPLKRHQVDIVQPFLSPATFFALSASMLAGVPIRVGSVRFGIPRKAPSSLKERLYESVELHLMKVATHVVVANSEAGREYLLRKGFPSRQTRVIYNGMEPQRLAVSDADRQKLKGLLPPNGPVIGIVARLDKEKDHHTFLQAASLIHKAIPNGHFLIVGDGPLRKRLEVLTRDLNLEGHVTFVGQQLNVAPYMERFDVAVLSSNANEGCSNFLLEAMAMGKPIVATDVGGNRELIAHGENGLLVPMRNPEALTDAVLSVLSDQAMASRMAAKGRMTFEGRFTIPRMVGAYEELYMGLLNGCHYSRSAKREVTA
jgi:glycosyltransferase involved in cell wall biosynthesis